LIFAARVRKEVAFSRRRRDSRMGFKVQVGPAQLAIHQGQSVLLTEPDGQVNWPSNRARHAALRICRRGGGGGS
jgi:hypothetical protein